MNSQLSNGAKLTGGDIINSEEDDFVQIWIFPHEQNVTSRYNQFNFTETAQINEFHQIPMQLNQQSEISKN